MIDILRVSEKKACIGPDKHIFMQTIVNMFIPSVLICVLGAQNNHPIEINVIVLLCTHTMFCLRTNKINY